MNSLADDIETFVSGLGKVPRSAVYTRFDLVAKRAIDAALETLAQSNRLVVGANDVAPVRQARRAQPAGTPADVPCGTKAVSVPDAMPYYATEQDLRQRREKTKSALGGATLREAILAQFEPGRMVSTQDVIAKLSKGWTDKSIRTELSTMKSLRLLENRKYFGWWLAGTLVEDAPA